MAKDRCAEYLINTFGAKKLFTSSIFLHEQKPSFQKKAFQSYRRTDRFIELIWLKRMKFISRYKTSKKYSPALHHSSLPLKSHRDVPAHCAARRPGVRWRSGR